MNTEFNHYDVGVVGVWSGCNYGSVATYYALHEILKSLGKSVLMIDKPIVSSTTDVEHSLTHSRRFANEHYDISQCYHLNDIHNLNDLCDSFIVGSDQVWNYGISKHTGHLMYLDFVDTDKKKISYASSLGHAVDFAPDNERRTISKLLSRFDAISVREESGVTILKNEYGIKAVQVLDPVFLHDSKFYIDLADKSPRKESEPFIAAYILDPTPEKREALLKVSQRLGGLKIVVMLDGLPWKFDSNKSLMNLPNCVEGLQVEDWLYYISKCSFLITDSCHGASFGIIFKKRFAAISNKSRGHTRFVSLLKNFNLLDRLVIDPLTIPVSDNLFDELNLNELSSLMTTKQKFSIDWLNSALSGSKKNEFELITQNLYENPLSSKVTKHQDKYDLDSFDFPLKFFFDKSIWDSHVILGRTTLIPISKNSPSKKFAFTILDLKNLKDNKIFKDQKYNLTLNIKFHTSSNYINLHIYNSYTKQFMIIKRINVDTANMNVWFTVDITFVADRDCYDSLMVGALQITGENRFISFSSIKILDSV